MMKIAINITTLLDQYQNRGIGIYTRTLVAHLTKNQDIEWHLIGFRDEKTNFKILDIKNKPKNLYFHSLGKIKPSGIWNILFESETKKILQAIQPDLYLNLNIERAMPKGKWKNVIMIHDLIPLITNSYSQKNFFFNFVKGIFYKARLRKAKKCDVIITNSNYSKTQIQNRLKIKTEKIFPIYLGLDQSINQEKKENDKKIKNILKSYGINHPYILYYGGLEKNKNLENLLRAFAAAKEKMLEYKLVIASGEFQRTLSGKVVAKTNQAKEIQNTVEKLNIQDEVTFAGFVDRKHLPIVLENSYTFVHLSKAEGFGLSVLEALLAQKPCLISNIPVYEELYKDFALFTNPTNKEEIAAKLLDICLEDTIRTQLLENSQNIQDKFNVEKLSTKTLDLLKKTVTGKFPFYSNEKRKKILFVAPFFYPFKGGAENYSMNIARQVALDENNEVKVLTSTFENVKSGYDDYQKISILRLQTWINSYYLRFYPKLFFALAKENPDIIHVQGFGFIWQDFCLIIKKFFSRKKIVYLCTPHGPFMARNDYPNYLLFLKKVFEKAMRIYLPWLYDSILADNPSQAKWITKYYNIPIGKIKSMPIGISSDHFANYDLFEIKKEIGFEENEIIMSYLGRFHKYKGVWDILEACSKLNSKKYAFKMIMMGADAGELGKMQRFIIQNRLEKKVILIHKPSDTKRNAVLELSEIFVFPSQWEAYGIAMVEAMAHKNAIITTKTEGGLYLIQNKINGILVSYNNPEELELAMIKLIEDKKLRRKMIAANFEKAKTQTWENLWNNYKDVYK
jgi:glycosyltransferase involved in cell wall biosynthesis